MFDAVRNHGGKPANYCEIGGNPSVQKACELTKLILSKPGVEKIAVMMNVVSNTRVDIVTGDGETTAALAMLEQLPGNHRVTVGGDKMLPR